MKNSYTGIALLLGKLGPKIIAVLAKMQDVLFTLFKSLFGVKSAGLVGSAGLYALLFTWEMGIALVVFIGVHEYGHVWAMKRCGIKTRGMFFIPGFGAVAIADEKFGSARNEAYIALMGPVWGIAFSFIAGAAYLYTHEPIFAAIAAFTAFINMVNLFPIYPLDGGRVLKSLAYTDNAQRSFAIIVAVSAVAALTGTLFGLILIIFMAGIGFAEVSKEFGIFEKIQNVVGTLFRSLFLFLGLLATGVVTLPRLMTIENRPAAQQAAESPEYIVVLLLIALIFIVGIVLYDIYRLTIKQGRWIWYYPVGILVSAREAVREIAALKGHHLTDIPQYDRMNNDQKVTYSALYLGLIVLHVLFIYQMGHVEGAEFAVDLLK